MTDRLLTFESVHGALKAERAIRKAGFKADAISVPRHLSGDCGIALKFDGAIEESVVSVMRDNDVKYRGIYDASEQ